MAETASNLTEFGGIAASTAMRAAWDRAYHEYERLSLLRDAYSDIGPLAEVNAEWDNRKMDIHAEFGSENCPAAIIARNSSWGEFVDRIQSEQNKYGSYCDAAEVALLDLMRTPSPDLAAARTKIEMCKTTVMEEGEYSQVIWQAIDADLRRMVRENP